ncbi:HepT-like ribonuclease domain-containing protein [Geoalkalibacter sp.]|uniref:HepT-like ribonuclease domain-containing protein n=1 Tax=Geoalkalibacter sp. TaxID=3041440 RepID=UPI00272ECCE4|nr:DUF86 domain-containing protein [Geoalkalibacter sp.]
MSKDDLIRIRHMVDAAREAISFAAGRRREDLDRDRMLVLSLVKSVEIMGEAAAKVSDSFRQQQPTLPWREMVAMRNRLIHGYFDINLDIVWQTVTAELPPLVEKMEAILSGQAP